MPRQLIAPLFALLVAGAAWSADPAAKNDKGADKPDPYDAAYKELLRTGRPIVVHFTTDNCLPCRRFQRETLFDTAVAAQLSDRFTYVRLHTADHPYYVREFKIDSFPTVVLVGPADPSGKNFRTKTIVLLDELLPKPFLKTLNAVPPVPK